MFVGGLLNIRLIRGIIYHKFMILIIFPFFTVAQNSNDTLYIDEVVINPEITSATEKIILQAVDIINISESTLFSDNDISTALKASNSVDIRQRSFSRVQSDINIRGGSFDQNIILLNGINLTDPQTGHHNLNIPINNSDLAQIEVLYGSASRVFGVNSFAGAVNFVTKIPESNSLDLDFSYGSFNTLAGNASLSLKGDKTTHLISADYSKSDGFDYNTDFSRLSFYYETNTRINSVDLKTMAGYYDIEFGALNFYTPQFPDQFEKIRSAFASLSLNWGKNINYSYNIYWRGLSDRFELFREGEGFYRQTDFGWINSMKQDTVTWYNNHNHHFTSVSGSGLSADKKWKLGKSTIGTDYRHELIYSNVLGMNMNEIIFDKYSKSDYRHNLTIFAEHSYKTDKFLLGFGAMSHWNQKYSWNYNYGGDIGYYIVQNLLVRGGINKSFRLPTYTDLYYQGPSNLGNVDLLPEKALNFEAGFKYLFLSNSRIESNIFYRKGDDIIAWVKEYDSNIWKTENLTKLNTRGFETSITYAEFDNESFINDINVKYMFLDMDKSASGLESKYSMDQLRHKLYLNINHSVFENISGAISFNFFKRNGEYDFFDAELNMFTGPEKYDNVFLLNYSLLVSFRDFRLYAKAYNITNVDYFDIGNVPTPGFHFTVGVQINMFGINFDK